MLTHTRLSQERSTELALFGTKIKGARAPMEEAEVTLFWGSFFCLAVMVTK